MEQKLKNMSFLRQNKLKFYCFTPEVAFATFVIELMLAGFVLYRYGLNKFTNVIILILFFLGAFQFAEFMICAGGDSVFWTKAGTISTTMLPALGLHLVSLLTKKTLLVQAGYAFAFLLIGAVLFLNLPFNSACTGKFVVLMFDDLFKFSFYFYYAVFLLIALWMLLKNWSKSVIFWVFAAYLSFIIPGLLVYFFIAVTRTAFPSIMCGFAIFCALILAFKVMPEISKKHKKK